MTRAAALALALLLAAPRAHAFVRTVNSGNLCLWWATRGHGFQIDAQGTPDVPGSAAFAAVRSSFAAWAAAPGTDLAFADLGLSTDPNDRKVGFFPGQVNRNLVLWRTASCAVRAPPGDACFTAGGCGNLYDCWEGSADVIATTTTTSNSLTGQIRDADIELNGSPASDGSRFVFTTVNSPPCATPGQTGCVRIDIQNTVTHEAGHTLGLDHSPDPAATMYAVAPAGEVSKRVLGQDDVLAVQTIYPPGQPTVTCLPSPNTLVQTGAANGGGCASAGAGAALPVVLLLGARRRRLKGAGRASARLPRAPPAPLRRPPG